jgi:hypothetical protein
MPNKRRDLYFGNNVNTLGHEDHSSQWSKAFKWYTKLPLEQNNSNKVWNFGIELEGCVPEVSYFKKLILWCVENFNSEKRINQLQGKTLIYLAPKIFIRILRLLESTMTFKSSEANAFLKANHGGMKILDNLILKLLDYSKNSTHIELCSLKYPYKEFTWLFSRIIGKESMTTVLRYVLYVFHLSIHESVLFDWDRIILSEVSFELVNFQKNKKFFMSSYLIFAIAYCHILE